MVFGEMLDRAGRVIDRGLAVRFPGPGSYTGEDCAEFHCHGSPVVLRELLSALFAAGARQAQAGEFTKRSFLNGRMDLTQAEAVVDLIDAETAAAARNAAAQLDGGLRRVLEPVQEELLEVTSRFYAVVDYRRWAAGAAAGHLPPGTGTEIRRPHGYCGPAQRGQVFAAQRPGGV